MTEPIRPSTQASTPVVDVEPVLISARPLVSASRPVPVAEVAVQCMSKLDGVALAAVAAPANPFVAGLVALKAGLELGECVTKTMDRAAEDASIRSALDHCAAAGGSPRSLIDGTLECAVPMAVRE